MTDEKIITLKLLSHYHNKILDKVAEGTIWTGTEAPTDEKYLYWIDESVSPALFKYKNSLGVWSVIGGGGGSSAASAVAIEAVSALAQDVSADDECNISFEWSSTAGENTKGTVTVYVNSARKHTGTYEQGEVTIPVQDYLVPGKTNDIEVVVRDIYGTENSISFTVAVISITVSSSFKQNTILKKETYPESYAFPIVVKGGRDKTVHVILDGEEIAESSIVVSAADSGAQKYVSIPSCSHGSHSLELYATVSLNGNTLTSNRINYDLIWTEDTATDIIIASPFDVTEADQYEPLKIPHFVYNPLSENTEVYYEVNGERVSDTAKIVNRTAQTWETSGDIVGDNVFRIVAGDKFKEFTVNCAEVETVDVSTVTDELLVCLIADRAHDNSISETRDVWNSTGEIADIQAEFTDFNWKTNGWTMSDGCPALNVSGGASVRIPYKIFEGALANGKDTDVKSVGCTVEMELSVSNVTDSDAPLFSCMSGGKGIEIMPYSAKIKSSGEEIETTFLSTEKMRFSFVITPEDPGIMYIYINGTGVQAETYTSADRFKQDTDPADMLFTSTGCDVTLHSVRVYRQALTQQKIVGNWIYDMASIANQVNAHKRNDIYDSTSGEILFSKLVEQIPCMIITGERPTYKGDKKIVDIKFTGTEDGLFDFEIYQVQIDVQGTSSQYYPEKNLKFKAEYKITDDAGNTVSKVKSKFEMAGGEVEEYALGENQIPATVFCLKTDYMETSSSHNTKTADIANAMYSEKTPPQKENANVRTTIYGRPIIVFFRDTEDSELKFGGKFNFNYDKDAEGVFGFTEDENRECIECVEFCNNTSERCLLSKSEYLNKIEAPADYDGDDIDANGQISEYLTDFEWRYYYRSDSSNNVKYDYLKAVTDWIVTTDRNQATGGELATPYVTDKGIAAYLYDENQNIVTFTDSNGKTRRAIDIGLGVTEYTYEEHSVVETDEEGNEITTIYYTLPIDEDGNEVYSFAYDTEAYRLSKFKSELEEHFNLHYVLMYFNLMDLLGMIDSSTKNMFWATWGERHEKHPIESGDKCVIWYPIFYDMDTMLGVSNAGKSDIPYCLEFDTKLENSEIGYAYNGANNVFWNNVKDAYAMELGVLFRSKVSDGTFSLKGLLGAYEEHTAHFPEAVFNEDAKKKLIDPLVDGYYGYSEDSTDEMVMQHPDYVYIMRGDAKLQHKFWLTHHFNYVCSKHVAGDYASDYITMRIYSPESDIVPSCADLTFTTSVDIYCRTKYGSKTVYSVVKHGVPTLIPAPADRFNDTETIIRPASKIRSLGDLSPLYARSMDFSKARELEAAIIGNATEGYSNPNLDEITFGSNPKLSLVNLINCPNVRGTLGLSGCLFIKTILADGTNITLLDVPEVGILEKVSLPETMLGVDIVDHPNLGDFYIKKSQVTDEEGTVSEIYNLETIRVENTPIDTAELITNSPNLQRVRVTGVNWSLDNDELLRRIKATLKGFDAAGADIDKPVITGDVLVTNIKDYLKDEIDSFFNNGIAVENLPELAKRDFRLTAKNVVQTHLVRFFDSVSDEPMASGITDNRVIRNGFAHYNGTTPVKEEDWAKTYAFSSWGVYVDGELTAIEDISAYPITADTDFYAIYAETKKVFTINFYRQNADTGYYDLHKIEQIHYDGTVTADTFPDEFSHEDYALRFKGWSTTAGADEAQIVPGGIIAVTEGSPYEQDYFAIYTVDYKHRITFVDYDGTTIKDTVIYYTGDTVVIPADPTRSPTVENVFSFSGWSLNGVDVIEIPTVGGNTYNITYKAVYSDELRPYTITFRDWDGTVLKTETVRYSLMPTPPEEDPTREETAQYFYDFDGWDKEVSAVTGDTVYTATYLATLRTYTVKWVNEDGSSLLEEDVNVPYGTMPTYDGATPTKAATAQYTYTFAGWHIDISTVTGNITYIATYTATVNTYTVTWKNADGTVLETDEKVPYGDMPEYNGETPTQASTAQYDFTFLAWDTEVSEVTGDVVYTATYTEHIRSYTIKFVDYNGTVLSTQSVEYGSMPTAPSNPSRTGYDFTGWGTITTVTGDKTYTAQYQIKTYTITWTLAGASATTTCEHGSTPTPPDGCNIGDSLVIDGTTYTITGWSPEITTATGDTTYSASAVAIRSATASSKPTKYGAKNSNVSTSKANSVITGEQSNSSYGYLYCGSSAGQIVYYGFNFEELRNKYNVKVTDIKVAVTYRSYNNNSGVTVEYRVTEGFNTSGSTVSTYTDLGDGVITIGANGVAVSNYTVDTRDGNALPNTLSWINANLESFLNGYTSNSFGIFFTSVKLADVKDLVITVDYTYEEEV